MPKPGRTRLRNPPNERLTSQSRTPAKAGGQNEEDTGPRLSPGNISAHTPERKCILSGRHAARDDLIRLALGPDGEVAPDVRARAPGRGAWIGVDRATLDAAQVKGKLKSALGRAFKTGDLSVPADLGGRIEAALRQSTLDRLGLEAKAGNLATGADRIDAAARRAARSRCCSTPPTPAPRAAASSTRPGGSAGTMREAAGKGWFSPKAGPYCHWRWAAKMWYMSPSSIGPRRRVSATRSGRWRAFIGRDAGLEAASGAPDAHPADLGPLDVSEGLE